MPRPVTALDKSDVLSGLFGTWDSLDRLLTGLSEDEWRSPTPLPGWSVHNVVAHIVGTESMLHGLSTPDADIDVSELEHVRQRRRHRQRMLGPSPRRTIRRGVARPVPLAHR